MVQHDETIPWFSIMCFIWLFISWEIDNMGSYVIQILLGPSTTLMPGEVVGQGGNNVVEAVTKHGSGTKFQNADKPKRCVTCFGFLVILSVSLQLDHSSWFCYIFIQETSTSFIHLIKRYRQHKLQGREWETKGEFLVVVISFFSFY